MIYATAVMAARRAARRRQTSDDSRKRLEAASAGAHTLAAEAKAKEVRSRTDERISREPMRRFHNVAFVDFTATATIPPAVHEAKRFAAANEAKLTVNSVAPEPSRIQQLLRLGTRKEALETLVADERRARSRRRAPKAISAGKDREP